MNNNIPETLTVNWKLIGELASIGAIGAALASIIVMCLMTPRSPKEWAVGLISTVMASIGGGAAVIQYYGLQEWANSTFGLVAMLGLVFACGLPGWAIVRWLFNYIRKRENFDLLQIAKETKDSIS